MKLAPILAFALLVAACGGDDDPGPVDAPVGGGADAGGADAGSASMRIIEADWSLEPGTEVYWCARVTLTEEIYVAEFHPVGPLGTHHTVLSLNSVGPGTPPDGAGECGNPFEFGNSGLIFTSGKGTDQLVFPEGTGVRIPAGTQLHLNLHLYNTDDAVLTGTSAVEVVPIAAADVTKQWRNIVWGKDIDLVVDVGVTTQTKTCTVQQEAEMPAFWPHMHQLGTHARFTLTPAAGGAPLVLFDAPYNFDLQTNVDLRPVQQLHIGDQFTLECTYDNQTGQPVLFGESSNEEMCYIISYISPLTGIVCN